MGIGRKRGIMRKKEFKKVMTAILAGAMVCSLAACGEPKANGDDKATAAASSEKVEKVEQGTPEEKELYGFSEPVTVKIGWAESPDFQFREGETPEDNEWVDLYAKHNIFQELIYKVDASQGGAKLANAITSGNYPDIILTQGSEYINYAKTGVIADISDVFEEYASDELREYVESDGGIGMTSAKVDGKLYGIPLLGNSYDAVMMMFIRQDWLDKVGMQVPKTMEELHEVAKAFTEKDPDGNGKNDTYGLALNGKGVFASNGGIQAFFEGYGAMPGYGSSFTFIEKDGEVIWGGAAADEMKAGLTLLHEMYLDGSIAKDFGVMDNDRVTEEFSSGRCGIMFAPMWGAMGPSASVIKSDINAHIIAAQIPDGMGEGSAKPWFTNATSGYYAVSSKCEHPEVLIKLLNLSVDVMCHTESDEEFATYIADSEWKFSLTRTLEPLKNLDNYYKESKALETGDISELNAEQKSDYSRMKAFLETMKTDNPDVENEEVQSGIGLYSVFGDPQGGYAVIDSIIKEDNKNVSAYNAIPTDTMVEKFPTLDKLAMETIVKIITGDAPVDSYDQFLENWYKLGGEGVTAEAQAGYDATQK